MPEKCDLNSILFLLTPAENPTKMEQLVEMLAQFERCCRGRAAKRGAADGVPQNE